MQIRIHRKPGPFGRRVQLDVLLDGKKALSLAEGEESLLTVSPEHSRLSVAMQGHVGSQTLLVSGEHTNFECGARGWLVLDLLNLCYLPILRNRVFYLRPAARPQRVP